MTQWLMWQMAGLGPMLGQAHHFRNYAKEKIPYAIDRYTDEARRLYGVLDCRLAGREYVAGEYSVADIACFPWILASAQGQSLEEFPTLRAWHERMAARPAVERGMDVGKEVRQSGMDEQARAILFGQHAVK